MSELVTGEAVVLELRTATFASRAVSFGIDLIVQGVALFGTLLLISATSSGLDSALQQAVVLVVVVLVIVGYPVTMETLTRGRTVGKLVMGLRTVRDDGGPIRFRHALVRGLAAVIELYATSGAVALVWSLANARSKRAGDYFAGTVVVRERVPDRGGSLATMPPPLAGWAATLDLSRLSPDLALAARQWLSRSRELDPAASAAMATRIAAAVAAAVTPPPPPGTPAWAYLSAVLAERRAREMARLGVGPQPPGRSRPAALPETAPQLMPQTPPPSSDGGGGTDSGRTSGSAGSGFAPPG